MDREYDERGGGVSTVRRLWGRCRALAAAVSVVVVVVASSLSAQSGLAASIWTPSIASAEPAVTILMTEYALGPAELETPTGPIIVRLVNAGIRRHTLTVLIDGVELVSPEVRPGDAADWSLTLPRPGRYDLWCNEYRHLEKGMGGTLAARPGIPWPGPTPEGR